MCRKFMKSKEKIKLDNLLIKDVQEHHSETVQLLNEYLNDELENENSIIKSEELNSEEVQMVITHKAEPIRDSIYISSIPFTPIHKETLELFSKITSRFSKAIWKDLQKLIVYLKTNLSRALMSLLRNFG